jgi:hypothetical protein
VIFRHDGTLWFAEEVVTDGSDQGIYQWEKVTAIYSGFGPPPAHPKDRRTFFYNKRQVKDFHGNPLETPRYIY